MIQNNNEVKKGRAGSIYIADRKATAVAFLLRLFQLRNTDTGTLLLIRRPQRVTG